MGLPPSAFGVPPQTTGRVGQPGVQLKRAMGWQKEQGGGWVVLSHPLGFSASLLPLPFPTTSTQAPGKGVLPMRLSEVGTQEVG